MFKAWLFRFGVALLLALLVVGSASTAHAYPGNHVFTNAENPTGSPGYVTSALWGAMLPTPAQTFGGCQGCHGPTGAEPSNINLGGTSLTGTPNFNVVAGTTTTFTLNFTSSKGSGGFLVMHDDTSSNDANGRLHRVAFDNAVWECKGAPAGVAPNRCNGTFQNNTEVMHRVIRPRNGSNVVSFQFQYDAPAGVCQTYSFGVWVNDVNGDLNCFNATDHPVFRGFTITTTCPNDGNPCTADQCGGGICSYPAGNAGTTCRGSAGVCDTAEVCTGSSASCPADSFQSGVACRASGGACDPAELCSGSSAACPADTILGAGTVCRSAAGVCDVAEACDGVAKTCPSNAFSSAVCRTSAGVCDVPESCPGNSADCPGNGFVGSGTSCRDASCTSNVATLPASCTGSSAACPTIQNVSCNPFTCDGDACAGGCATDAQCLANNYCAGGLCVPKVAQGGACSANNQCGTGICVDGVCCDAACGGGNTADCRACNVAGSVGQCVPIPSGQTCRASTGTCDPAETCNGVAVTCPADARSTAGTVCRAANGSCDLAEVCDGSTAACPANAVAGAGVVCRASAGDCDVQEICNGQSPACPANAFSPSSVTCRAAAGPCDLQESCTGSSAACPSNALRPSSAQCRAPSCLTGTAIVAQNCTGSATSCPAVQTVDCDPYVCGATACLGDCVADVQCLSDHYCSAGMCVPKQDIGSACSADSECEGGRCVDGFCCNSDCTGQCEACSVAGSEGTCVPVSGAPVGQRVACSSDGSVCGGTCDGTLRLACSFPGTGASCRGASCDAGVATLAAFCDGRGACPAAFEQACPNSECSGTDCGADCVLDADCAPGEFCSAGICVQQQARGEPCPSDAACSTTLCVDGICCNSGCTGQCEACNVAGKEGTCSAVTGAPRGARTACTTDGSPCGGVCDGNERAGCSYPEGTACRAASCAKGVATLAAACSGDGRCPAEQQQDCLPNACSGTRCGGAGACTTNAQCDDSEWCSGGVCVPTLGVGAPCSADAQCTLDLCVDGFCCSQACDGQCQACDVPGREGFCETLEGGLPHGGRDACPGWGPCGGECAGAGNSCGFPTAERQCGKTSCTDGVETDAATCNGAGSCISSDIRSCGRFVCGEEACLDTCETNEECATGFICEAGQCLLPEETEPGTGGMGNAGDGPVPTAGTTNGPSGGTGSGGEPATNVGGDAGPGPSPEAGAGDGVEPGGSSTDEGSCGCRTVGGTRSSASFGWLLLVVALAARSKRRARIVKPLSKAA